MLITLKRLGVILLIYFTSFHAKCFNNNIGDVDKRQSDNSVEEGKNISYNFMGGKGIEPIMTICKSFHQFCSASDKKMRLIEIEKALETINETYSKCNNTCNLGYDIRIVHKKKDFMGYKALRGSYGIILHEKTMKYINSSEDTTITITTLFSPRFKTIDQKLHMPENFVSLELSHKFIKELSEEHRVKIIFPKSSPGLKKDITYECVYWNGDYESGSWNTSGCRYENRLSNNTHIMCSSNHLSKFSFRVKTPHNRTSVADALRQKVCKVLPKSCPPGEIDNRKQMLLKIKETLKSINQSLIGKDEHCHSSCNLGIDIRVSPMENFTEYKASHGSYEIILNKHIMQYTGSPKDTSIKITTIFHPVIREMVKHRPMPENFVSLVLSQKLVKKLSEEHRVKIVFPKPSTALNISNASYQCVYWHGDYESGSWNPSGCQHEKVLSNNTHIVCSCNHFTDFSMLLTLVPVKNSKLDHKVLHWISTIGCSISAVFLVLMLAVIVRFRNLRRDLRYQIHLNLCIALLTASILFLFAELSKREKGACFSLSVLLYYFFLSSFCWMLCEGVFVWRGLILVFNDSDKIRNYCLFSWGLPLICVAIITAIFRKDVYNNESCWLSWKRYAIWAFVGPVILISLINIFIMYTSFKIVKKQQRKEAERNIQFTARYHLILLPIFGSTWIVGIFALNEDTVAFQYVFTLLNSFQGFFIFLFYVYHNQKVRYEFRRKLRTYREKSMVYRSKRTSSKQSRSKNSSGNKDKGKGEELAEMVNV